MTDTPDSPPVAEATPPPAADAGSEAESKPHRRKASHRRHGKGMGALLASLLLLVVSAAFAYVSLFQQPRQIRDLQRDLAQTRDQLLASQQQTSERLSQLADRQEQEHRQGQGEIQSLHETDQMLQNNVVALQEKIGNSDGRWRLTEVEYLLQTAADKLQLEGDAPTALQALGAADERLKRLADPRFTGLRAALARDIQSLAAVPKVDTTGIVLELAAIEEQIHALPAALHSEFAFAPGVSGDTSVADHDPAWSQTLKAVWHDIRQLVVIRHRDKPVEPLLPPEMLALQMASLRLELQVVRLAVMRRDTASFQQGIARVDTGLRAGFDVKQPLVAAMLESLAKYRSLELRPPLPELKASLQTLRQGRKSDGDNNTDSLQPER